VVLPSKRFTIWQRMYNRYQLEPSPADSPATPGLFTVISPTIDVEDFNRALNSAITALDLTGSAGTVVAAVTAGVERRLRILAVSRDGSTANSAIAILVDSNMIPLTALSTSEAQLQPPRLYLGPGDSIGMLTTGDAGDDTRNCRVLFEEEIHEEVESLP